MSFERPRVRNPFEGLSNRSSKANKYQAEFGKLHQERFAKFNHEHSGKSSQSTKLASMERSEKRISQTSQLDLKLEQNWQKELSQLKQEKEEIMEKNDSLEMKIVRLENEKRLLEDKIGALQDDQRKLMSVIEKKNTQVNFRAIKLLFKLKDRPSKNDLEKKNILKNEACFDTYIDQVEKDENLKIPKLVAKCISLIEAKESFMTTSGIYRVSGNHSTIQKLRFEINNNSYTLLEKQKEPHEITGILKLFLRELKEPLLSASDIEKFAGNSETFERLNDKDKITILRDVLNSITPVKRDTLKELMKHFRKIADHDKNEMNSKSLAIVIGTCIFYDTMTETNPEKLLTICALPTICLQLMIDNVSSIFPEYARSSRYL